MSHPYVSESRCLSIVATLDRYHTWRHHVRENLVERARRDGVDARPGHAGDVLTLWVIQWAAERENAERSTVPTWDRNAGPCHALYPLGILGDTPCLVCRFPVDRHLGLEDGDLEAIGDIVTDREGGHVSFVEGRLKGTQTFAQMRYADVQDERARLAAEDAALAARGLDRRDLVSELISTGVITVTVNNPTGA